MADDVAIALGTADSGEAEVAEPQTAPEEPSTETDDAEVEPSPYADKSLEEIAALVEEKLADERKKVEHSTRESERQKRDHKDTLDREAYVQQVYAAQRTQITNWRTESALMEFADAFKEATGEEPTREQLARFFNVSQKLEQDASVRSVSSLTGFVNAALAGYTVSPEINNRYRAAEARHDYPAMHKAALDAYASKVLAEETPKLRAGWEKEQDDKNRSSDAVAKQRTAEAEAKGKPSPTGTRGTSPGSGRRYSDRKSAQKALMAGDIDFAEYKRAGYLSLPD